MKAKLTSHFANNTATVFDFELAEKMNIEYKNSVKQFNQFPKITDKQIVSLQVAVLLFGGCYFYAKFVKHLIEDQVVVPLVEPSFLLKDMPVNMNLGYPSKEDPSGFAKGKMDEILFAQIAK